MQYAIKFLPLCFFSTCPEISDYPVSKRILRNVLVAHFVLGFSVVNQLIEPVEAILLVLLEMLLTQLFVWGTAVVMGRRELFLLLAIGIVVCANIIGLFGFPIAFWLNIVDNERVHLPFYLSAGIFVWYLAVVGFLLNRFMGITPSNCIALSIIYFLVAYVGAFGVLSVFV